MGSKRRSLTSEEFEIVQKYLQGTSIRQLSEEYKGYGRTRINNILELYKEENPNEAPKIDEMKLKGKTHKSDVTDYSAEPLTDDEVIKAYEDIKNGTTLTKVAKDLGRTRDFVKKQIIDYIDEPDEIREFEEQLQKNQHPTKNNDLFYNATEEQKKKMIFERLNARRALHKRTTYSEQQLERKFNRLKKYFLATRNEKCDNKLTENNFYRMLYDTPTLLSSSFSSKILPAMNNLDYNPDVGIEEATNIIKADASILCSAIARTNLQIRILKENNLLRSFFVKPRNFRTSPELMYALIEYKKDRMDSYGEGENISLSSSDDIFITRTRLLERFSTIPKSLMERYDIKKDFGDDEYFDR